MIENREKKQIFTFEKLEPANVWIFYLFWMFYMSRGLFGFPTLDVGQNVVNIIIE